MSKKLIDFDNIKRYHEQLCVKLGISENLLFIVGETSYKLKEAIDELFSKYTKIQWKEMD